MMNDNFGILVISHGSTEAAWVETVEHAVAGAKLCWLERATSTWGRVQRSAVPLFCSYLELVDGKLIQDGIDALEKEGVTTIYVMPLFVSGGSSHVEEIKQAFGFSPVSDYIGDLEPLRFNARIVFDEPIGAEPEIIAIVKEQIGELLAETAADEQADVTCVAAREQNENSGSLELSGHHASISAVASDAKAVLLLGHGSSMPYFYELWEAGMKGIAAKVQAELNARERTALADTAAIGDMETADAATTGDTEATDVKKATEATVSIYSSERTDSIEVTYAPLLPEGSRAALEELLQRTGQVIVIPVFISPGYFTRTVIPKRLEGLYYKYSGKTFLPHAAISELLARRFEGYALERE